MTPVQHVSSSGSQGEAAFQSTLWSQVRVAGKSDAPNARHALENLCQLYWRPIYAFLRSNGQERQNARDLTQGFFAYLLEQDLLQKANPERGRFRSFLLGSLKNFVSNQRARQNALKRGGGVALISLNVDPEEGGLLEEPATDLTPERLFDRRWALTVLEEAMQRLAAEYRRAGLSDQFEALMPFLTGDSDHALSDLAAQLGKSAGALRVHLFRLRNRFRKLIRSVIADTVSDLAQVEIELKELEAALRES